MEIENCMASALCISSDFNVEDADHVGGSLPLNTHQIRVRLQRSNSVFFHRGEWLIAAYWKSQLMEWKRNQAQCETASSFLGPGMLIVHLSDLGSSDVEIKTPANCVFRMG